MRLSGYTVPDLVGRELTKGDDFTLRPCRRHVQVFVGEMCAGKLPLASSSDSHRASKNVVAMIRRLRREA